MYSTLLRVFRLSGRRVAVAVCVCAACGSLLSGCGQNPARHCVEPTLAKSILVKVLDSWQQGNTPDWWSHQTPPVIVQDVDWERGFRLSNYEITSDGEALDANFICPVKLFLKDAEGNITEKQIAYLVGTSPVLTVFRQINM